MTTPFKNSILGEYTSEAVVDEILQHKPEGVKQLVKSRSTERELGEASNAQNELDDLKILLETQIERPTQIVKNKVEEYLDVWAKKYNPDLVNEKILVSLDQREFADIFIRVYLVWDELSEKSREAAVELASKVVAIEKSSQELRSNSPKDNITAYSNLNGMCACSILKDAGQVEAEPFLKEFVDSFKDHVKESVQEDGSVYDYYHRDSVHYQVFNQIAWEKTLLFLDYINTPVPEETRDLVQLARNFCMEYIEGDKKHLEFIHSENKNDAQLPSYRKPFDKNSFVCKQLLAYIK